MMELGALGFWMFIAIATAAGIWGTTRKRDTEHETLRRMLESGQPVDEKVVAKILQSSSGNEELARDLKVGGLITLCIAPGLLLFGWIMGIYVEEKMLGVMGAVAALVLCVSAGLLIASRSVAGEQRYRFGPNNGSNEI